MRVTIAMPSTGIFYAPGLAAPVAFDTAVLPKAQAARLKTLVRDARFLDRPAAPDSLTSSVPDARQITVTVEEDGVQRTMHLTEPIRDPALKALVRFLNAEARTRRGSR